MIKNKNRYFFLFLTRESTFSLYKFETPDILWEISKIILSSMKLMIQIECYPKKIEKRLDLSLCGIKKEFMKIYAAVISISYILMVMIR